MPEDLFFLSSLTGIILCFGASFCCIYIALSTDKLKKIGYIILTIVLFSLGLRILLQLISSNGPAGLIL